MEQADFYRGRNYPLYFQTWHWRTLKQVLLYENERAECFICGIKYHLLPHHFDYKSLFNERALFVFFFLVMGDVAVVCFDCHTKIHFKQVLWFRMKTPVKRYRLITRMFLLRYSYCIRHWQIRRLLVSNLFYRSI
jgi:hypothetical protein